MLQVKQFNGYCNVNEYGILTLSSQDFKKFYKTWVKHADNESEVITALIDYADGIPCVKVCKAKPSEIKKYPDAKTILNNLETLKALSSGQAIKKDNVIKTVEKILTRAGKNKEELGYPIFENGIQYITDSYCLYRFEKPLNISGQVNKELKVERFFANIGKATEISLPSQSIIDIGLSALRRTKKSRIGQKLAVYMTDEEFTINLSLLKEAYKIVKPTSAKIYNHKLYLINEKAGITGLIMECIGFDIQPGNIGIYDGKKIVDTIETKIDDIKLDNAIETQTTTPETYEVEILPNVKHEVDNVPMREDTPVIETQVYTSVYVPIRPYTSVYKHIQVDTSNRKHYLSLFPPSGQYPIPRNFQTILTRYHDHIGIRPPP